MRVLGRVRLSRATDESTSTERQREIIQQWTEANQHELVAFAEDLDVSGSVDAFETPVFGDWLNNRPDQFDVVCTWRLDRLGRDAIRLNKLFGWAIDNGKTVVSATEGIDLATPVGRLIANVIAFLAEGELEAIRERTRASQKRLREVGRWGGGRVFYGYQAQERTESAGWELIPDPYAAGVLMRIIDKVLNGQSLDSIAREMQEQSELSPADYLRYRSGKPVEGSAWAGPQLFRMLRSKSLLGHATHNGVTVRDGDGMPIRKGEPLIPQEVFDQLQAALEARKSLNTRRSAKTSPLLGVAVCAVCGRSLHQRRANIRAKTSHTYYGCVGNRAEPHPGNFVRAEYLETLLEEEFLSQLGREKLRERVFIPAENHQIELEEAIRAIDELTSLLGTITSDTMRSRLTEQMRALDLRVAALEQMPAREAQWEYRETHQTYKDAWDKADTEGRRQLLLRSGITCVARGRKPGEPSTTEQPDFELRVPADLLARLSR